MRVPRFALLGLLLTTVLAGATAETTNPMDAYPRALGGSFGPIIGTGLSFQRWFGETGVQSAAGVIYQPDEEMFSGDILWYLATVGGQRVLYRETFSDWFAGGLYAFAGLAQEGRIRQVASYPEDGAEPEVRVLPFEPFVAIGGGVGIESVFFRHFSIPVEFGIRVQWLIPSIVPVNAGFVGGVGLRYRF